MSFSSLSNILPESVKKSGASKQIGEAFILAKVPKIIERTLGIEVENRLRPLYIKNKTLVLACLDERLILVLKEETGKILQTIEAELGSGKIEAIQFVD